MDSDQLSNISEDEDQTIIQKKKKNVKLSDAEILLMLRSYQVYPCSWIKIIQCMRENKHHLPDDAQFLLGKSGQKQLKNRLSNELAKLLATPEENIKNELIRLELQKIKEYEKRLLSTVNRKKSSKRPLPDLVRANQEAYNDFITKKVPKLLRALGVSSDSE
ncbi:uncharacterized protein LOC125657393 [Ostrea edulis]|uniref:uncharacterized protein LOC125657393 n=1 Tax=Ostrea edulis TaxID=37623 RepID=UPI0024AFAE8A|nr:uncharacterized protein LOC125657393 [Ostrea edulis]